MKLCLAVLALSSGAIQGTPLLRLGSKQKELLQMTEQMITLESPLCEGECRGDFPYGCATNLPGKVKYGCTTSGGGCNYLAEGEHYPHSGFCTFKDDSSAPTPPAPTPTAPTPTLPTPSHCDVASCNENVWNSQATKDGHTDTCGNRFTWLREHEGDSERDACRTITADFPSICPCDDGASGPTVPSQPSPTPPSPPSPSGDVSNWNGQKFWVLSGNHYWWNLMQQRGGNNGSMGKLYRSQLDAGKKMHLGGFQECDDISIIMRDAQMESTHAHKQFGGALAIMWDKSVFGDDEIASSGHECDRVAHDRPEQDYGFRLMCWVQLRHRDSARLVTFATLHGPLPRNTGGIDGPEGYVDKITAVKERVVPSDANDATFLMVGDFNNSFDSRAIRGLSERFDAVPEKHGPGRYYDYHFVSKGAYKSGEGENIGNGGSDHPQMLAEIELN